MMSPHASHLIYALKQRPHYFDLFCGIHDLKYVYVFKYEGSEETKISIIPYPLDSNSQELDLRGSSKNTHLNGQRTFW